MTTKKNVLNKSVLTPERRYGEFEEYTQDIFRDSIMFARDIFLVQTVWLDQSELA